MTTVDQVSQRGMPRWQDSCGGSKKRESRAGRFSRRTRGVAGVCQAESDDGEGPEADDRPSSVMCRSGGAVGAVDGRRSSRRESIVVDCGRWWSMVVAGVVGWVAHV